MLVPDLIPHSEPQINVGIILPEDNINQLSLQLPISPEYQIFIDNRKTILKPKSIIKLSFYDGKIQLDLGGEILFSSDKVKINPSKRIKPSNKSGIKIGPVIAGRGFHWQKNIDVFLPDTLFFKIINRSLTLVNQVPLEHYVMCVSTSEMSAECPVTMIESQTIAARSWLLANVEQKHLNLGMDTCNDDCCQRYQGTTFLSKQSIAGALNTTGQVLMHNNKICDARYSKSCGGVMERFGTIWPGGEKDYLQAIPDSNEKLDELQQPLSQEKNFNTWVNSTPETFCSPKIIPENRLKKYLGSVDEEGEYFRWQLSISNEELKESINAFADISAIAITEIEVLSRGASGRINKLNIHYLNQTSEHKIYLIDSEYNVRRFLSKKFLFSSAFIITPVNTTNEIPENFILIGAGWGHGVGLCQIGALGMALKGFLTQDILYHYYPGSFLTKIY